MFLKGQMQGAHGKGWGRDVGWGQITQWELGV